jgi:hypothetical protein
VNTIGLPSIGWWLTRPTWLCLTRCLPDLSVDEASGKLLSDDEFSLNNPTPTPTPTPNLKPSPKSKSKAKAKPKAEENKTFRKRSKTKSRNNGQQ